MDRLHIVVIDDVIRFALHVWRYVSGSPGFAIGDVPKRGRDGLFWRHETADTEESCEPLGLALPDGTAVVWWVEARDDRWDWQLESVMNSIAEDGSVKRWIALVDVRGAANKGGGHNSPYTAAQVIAKLEERGGVTHGEERGDSNGHILLVSSYRSHLLLQNEERVPVFSKSGTVFEQFLASRLRPNQPRRIKEKIASQRPESIGMGFLITGAGFEIADALPGRGPGLPFTSEIMKKFLSAASLGLRPNKSKRWNEGFAFPIPESLTTERRSTQGDFEELWKAAKYGDLDTYWNELIRLELLELDVEKKKRRSTKEASIERELKLREAFRDVLVQFDWGYLQQALDAAQLPFCAWLSTNYTRFGNRAVQTLNERSTRSSAATAQPWRVVATSNEATRLLQELLHKDPIFLPFTDDKSSVNGEKPTVSAEQTRYLFKLHGDIPHVTTMALAGHDKEVWSPLSVPIDNLHLMYLVAERELERLTSKQTQPIQWHIVGHSLWDVPLKRLIRRVVLNSQQCEHIFYIVVPEIQEDKKAIWHRLLQVLSQPDDLGVHIRCIASNARDYMARLTRAGQFDVQALNLVQDGSELDSQLQSLGFCKREPAHNFKIPKRCSISWWRKALPENVSSEVESP